MDEKTAAKIEAQAEKFDAKRDPNYSCYLLKRGEHSGAWEGTEITSGYLWDREADQFAFAKTASDFRDLFAGSTAIAYGDEETLEIFEMDDSQKDYKKPDTGSPLYVVVAPRLITERFEP